MMKNFKDSIKLFRLHIVVLLFLVVGIIIGIASLKIMNKQMEILYNETYTVNHAAHSMNAAFEEIQKSIFSVAVIDSHDAANQEIANVKENATILQEQISLIKYNFSGDTIIVARLENNLAELAPMRDHVLNLAVRRNNGDAVEYMENNNSLLYKEAQGEVELLIESTDAMGNNLFASIQATQQISILLLVFLAIICVLFSIVVISKRAISKGTQKVENTDRSIDIT